jgi:hypothetical protein
VNGEHLDRRALRIWLDAASNLFADARVSLTPAEFDVFLDVFVGLIGRHYARQEVTSLALHREKKS